MSRGGRLFGLALACLAVLPGCMLIGAGVGALAPTGTELKATTHAERGDTVQLKMASGEKLSGVVGPNDDTHVEIETSRGAVSVPIDHIRAMWKQVEADRAKHALLGWAIGASVDVTVVVAIFIYGLAIVHARPGASPSW